MKLPLTCSPTVLLGFLLYFFFLVWFCVLKIAAGLLLNKTSDEPVCFSLYQAA